MLSWRKGKEDEPEPAPARPTASRAAPQHRASNLPATGQEDSGISRLRLGEILLREGAITKAQLDAALNHKDKTGGFLGQALVELGFLDRERLMSFLVKQCRIPHISLIDYEISPDLLQLVPAEVCRTHHLLPIDKLGRILTVAMVNPLDTDALEEVRRACPELKIKPILCDWDHFARVASRVLAVEDGEHDELTAKEVGISLAPFKPGVEPAALEAAADAPAAEAAAPAPAPPAEAHKPPLRLIAPDDGLESDSFDFADEAEQVDIEAAVEGGDPVVDGFRRTMHRAVAESLSAALRSAQAPAGASDWANQFARLVRRDMDGAVDRSVDDLVAHLQYAARSRGASLPADAERLDAVIRESLEGMLSTALDAAARQLANSVVLENEAMRSAMAQQTRSITDAAASVHDAVDFLQQAVQRISVASADNAIMPVAGARPMPEASLSGRGEGMSFDDFVVGQCNSLAFTLGRTVGESPGDQDNPFLVYGGAGCGKTHLVTAMGRYANGLHPEMHVLVLSGGRYVRRVLEAKEHDAIPRLRASLGRADMMVLDDLQLLAGQADVQLELLWLCDRLRSESKQMVFACTSLPGTLEQMNPRLVALLDAGTVVQIQPPDADTRIAILQSQVLKNHVPVPQNVLAAIADKAPDDIRRMLGVLHKVISFARLVGQDISVGLVEEITTHLRVK